MLLTGTSNLSRSPSSPGISSVSLGLTYSTSATPKGLHTIAGLTCKGCAALLGWTYVSLTSLGYAGAGILGLTLFSLTLGMRQLKAYEASQKYKEGRFIIEKGKVVKVRPSHPLSWAGICADIERGAGQPMVKHRLGDDWFRRVGRCHAGGTGSQEVSQVLYHLAVYLYGLVLPPLERGITFATSQGDVKGEEVVM